MCVHPFRGGETSEQRSLLEHFRSLTVLIKNDLFFPCWLWPESEGWEIGHYCYLLPLYLAEDLNMNLAVVGVHLNLLQAMSIALGPIWG